MFCKKCGKEIKDGTVFCPECGAPQTADNENGFNNTAAVQGSTKNTLCIVGFVISIISIFLNFYGIVGIAGIIVSVIGLTDCKKKNQSGNKLAIAGIIIGVISVIYAFAVSMAIIAYLW